SAVIVPPMRTCLLLSIALFASCTTTDRFEYSPPPDAGPAPSNERLVQRPFDQVWSCLIESVGKTFFAIDNFERDSGLLTLSFSTRPFSHAVDGGHVRVLFDNSSAVAGRAFWFGGNQQATKIDFDGNYADWVEQYLGGQMNGRMNIVVRKASENTTRVTINTRFVITSVSTFGGTATTTTWSWSSGERASQTLTDKKGNRVSRVFQSTGFVEKKILDQLELLAPAEAPAR
ncbi:MAG: hypothetical protein U1F60_09925, partial [Planctomycetota bacterium]